MMLCILPSRVVFKHHVLPLGESEVAVRVATYDVFNLVARRLVAQQLPGRKIEWVISPRGQLVRAIKSERSRAELIAENPALADAE